MDMEEKPIKGTAIQGGSSCGTNECFRIVRYIREKKTWKMRKKTQSRRDNNTSEVKCGIWGR